MSEGGKSTQIRDFKDKANRTALPIIDIVDIMKPGTINYEFVKTGSSLSDEVGQIIDDQRQIRLKLKKEKNIWRSMEYGVWRRRKTEKEREESIKGRKIFGQLRNSKWRRKHRKYLEKENIWAGEKKKTRK